MGRKSINDGGVEASRSEVEVGNLITFLSESGRNYNCCKWDDNLCDGGSVLTCVIRRQRVKNVEGK